MADLSGTRGALAPRGLDHVRRAGDLAARPGWLSGSVLSIDREAAGCRMTLQIMEQTHVRRRSPRPDHDRPQPSRSVFRPGAGHAWRYVRGGCRLLPRNADEAERGG